MITSGRIYTKKHITGVSLKPKSRFLLDILPTQKRKQVFSVSGTSLTVANLSLVQCRIFVQVKLAKSAEISVRDEIK